MRDPPEHNPHQRRQQALGRLGEDLLDVLVLGGGIVGSGVARDAAMRGLRVGLVEQSDFASGTSSRSSHLLHGGLRYLAQGYLRLVHEASMEKRVIHRIAPHLADPLAFVFPTRPGWAWAKWKLSVGVKLYDLLCGRRNLGKSSTLGRREVYDLLPGLTKKDITGAVRYYDGLTNDARLVIDTASLGGGPWGDRGELLRLPRRRASGRPLAVPRPGRRRRRRDRDPRPTGRQRHRPVVGSNPPQPHPAAADQGRPPGDRPPAAAGPRRRGADRGLPDPVRDSLGRASDPGHDRHRLRRPDRVAELRRRRYRLHPRRRRRRCFRKPGSAERTSSASGRACVRWWPTATAIRRTFRAATRSRWASPAGGTSPAAS